MFLTKVDISKTAYFMTTQTFSQEVTKFIPCDDVTRFDGTSSLKKLAKKVGLWIRICIQFPSWIRIKEGYIEEENKLKK